MNLYSAKEVRKLDSLIIKNQKISAFQLMQKAAEFSFNVLLNHWPNTKRIYIFSGSGKNSGDGYLLAKIAKEHGLESFIITTAKPKVSAGITNKAYKLALKAKVKTISMQSFKKESLKDSVIVDSLIGTGLKGKVRKSISNLINEINAKKKFSSVLSIDIPSGICADTGSALDSYVEADVTATFIGRKKGCFTSTGKAASGIIEFNDLGASYKLKNKIKPNTYKLDMEKGVKKLKTRKEDSHKGNFGHTLVIGGDRGFGGAAILASKAAVYSGAGLVSLATRPVHLEAALSSCPEVMVNGVESGQEVEELLTKASVVVLGPGLGNSAWSEQMLQRTFMEAKRRKLPIVLDADGLNLLTKLKLSSGLPTNLVITPHPGEAAKLLNKTSKEIQLDRFKSIRQLQRKFKAICVLKGSGSLVCYRKNYNQMIGVCDAGNPGMAKGGMGDVLAGIIGSFISQKLNLIEATETAVDLHSKAADLSYLELGISFLPTEVIQNARLLIR